MISDQEWGADSLLVASLVMNGALLVQLGKTTYGMMSLIFTVVLIVLFTVNHILSVRRGVRG